MEEKSGGWRRDLASQISTEVHRSMPTDAVAAAVAAAAAVAVAVHL